jgi:hypothetical protein
MVGGQDVGHLPPVDCVDPLGQQVQVVAVLGEKTNRGLKVSEEAEMRG